MPVGLDGRTGPVGDIGDDGEAPAVAFFGRGCCGSLISYLYPGPTRGLAWASCSSSQPETSVLGPAAIAWLLLIEIFGRTSQITRWPPAPHGATLTSANPAAAAGATPVPAPCQRRPSVYE